MRGGRAPRDGPTRQSYPLLAGFLLLLTWPLAVCEEARGRK
jgi:hypothetical protein